MARVVVPAAQAPGNGIFAKQLDLCDLWSTRDDAPEAWVTVQIAPFAGTTVTPDALGNYLHLLIEFPQPTARYGKRNEILAGFAPTSLGSANGPVQVETDPGTYFFGYSATAKLVGGTPGDVYEVTAWAQAVRDIERTDDIDLYEPPSNNYVLTYALGAPPGATPFPRIAPYHSHIWIVEGSLTVGGIPLTTGAGRAAKVPLQGAVLYTTAGLYQTGTSL
jgi:hypothetical protein